MTIDQSREKDSTSPATHAPSPDPIAALRRPSGGLAMLAIDQREALRSMMSDAADDGHVSDDRLREFKVDAARILTPYASAILIDHQFGWDAVLSADVVAPTCALISSADEFLSSATELVSESRIDTSVDLRRAAQQGAVAAKLLVLYRADEPSSDRIRLVDAFVERCRDAGLAAIIEPVVRDSRDGRPADLGTQVVAAAHELGNLGADLYKAQVPFAGNADDDVLIGECRAVTEAVASPWVVLSSGVAPTSFPRAVRLAVRAGASGFLAGRAIWAPSLSAASPSDDMAVHATARLQALGECVDEELHARSRPASHQR